MDPQVNSTFTVCLTFDIDTVKNPEARYLFATFILPPSQKTSHLHFVRQFLARPMTSMTTTITFPIALGVFYSKNGVGLLSWRKCGHSSQETWKSQILKSPKIAKSGQL